MNRFSLGIRSGLLFVSFFLIAAGPPEEGTVVDATIGAGFRIPEQGCCINEPLRSEHVDSYIGVRHLTSYNLAISGELNLGYQRNISVPPNQRMFWNRNVESPKLWYSAAFRGGWHYENVGLEFGMIIHGAGSSDPWTFASMIFWVGSRALHLYANVFSEDLVLPEQRFGRLGLGHTNEHFKVKGGILLAQVPTFEFSALVNLSDTIGVGATVHIDSESGFGGLQFSQQF